MVNCPFCNKKMYGSSFKKYCNNYDCYHCPIISFNNGEVRSWNLCCLYDGEQATLSSKKDYTELSYYDNELILEYDSFTPIPNNHEELKYLLCLINKLSII